ncbi:hypothetical protein MTO96_038307 [Rhipicephalus appendiculatus]
MNTVHCVVFKNFLGDVSGRGKSEDSNKEAVVISHAAPADARAERSPVHSVERLPSGEVFLKFKSHAKAYLSERPDFILATPQGVTAKEHRRSLLLDAARHSMQRMQSMDSVAFDRDNSFVSAALREDQL